MNLQDIIAAAQQLPPEELQELRHTLNEMEFGALIPPSKPLEMDALRAAFARMREGLSDDEIDAITQAMEAEYIEPVNDHEWDM
jgi:hypothetical protein